MKKILFYLGCLLLGYNNPAISQSLGNYFYNTTEVAASDFHIPVNYSQGNTIRLKADILMNVPASSYTAIFSISQSGESVSLVDSLMSDRLREIKRNLSRLGVDEKNVHVDAVSSVPVYSYVLEEKKFSKRAIEIPAGFETKKNIHILFTDHAILDNIISIMALEDVYDLIKVEYNVGGSQAFYDELRNAALGVIETKSKTYDALNMHLDIVNLADGFSCIYPMERYKSFTAYNSGSTIYEVTAARQNNIQINGDRNTVHLDKTKPSTPYFLENTAKKSSIFYDRIAYNQFDKIINPDFEEPSIQYMYTLEVTFTVMKKTDHERLQNLNKLETLQPLTDKKRKGKRNQ